LIIKKPIGSWKRVEMLIEIGVEPIMNSEALFVVDRGIKV
jgi:hypothetical protein